MESNIWQEVLCCVAEVVLSVDGGQEYGSIQESAVQLLSESVRNFVVTAPHQSLQGQSPGHVHQSLARVVACQALVLRFPVQEEEACATWSRLRSWLSGLSAPVLHIVTKLFAAASASIAVKSRTQDGTQLASDDVHDSFARAEGGISSQQEAGAPECTHRADEAANGSDAGVQSCIVVASAIMLLQVLSLTSDAGTEHTAWGVLLELAGVMSGWTEPLETLPSFASGDCTPPLGDNAPDMDAVKSVCAVLVQLLRYLDRHCPQGVRWLELHLLPNLRRTIQQPSPSLSTSPRLSLDLKRDDTKAPGRREYEHCEAVLGPLTVESTAIPPANQITMKGSGVSTSGAVEPCFPHHRDVHAPLVACAGRQSGGDAGAEGEGDIRSDPSSSEMALLLYLALLLTSADSGARAFRSALDAFALDPSDEAAELLTCYTVEMLRSGQIAGLHAGSHAALVTLAARHLPFFCTLAPASAILGLQRLAPLCCTLGDADSWLDGVPEDTDASSSAQPVLTAAVQCANTVVTELEEAAQAGDDSAFLERSLLAQAFVVILLRHGLSHTDVNAGAAPPTPLTAAATADALESLRRLLSVTLEPPVLTNSRLETMKAACMVSSPVYAGVTDAACMDDKDVVAHQEYIEALCCMLRTRAQVKLVLVLRELREQALSFCAVESDCGPLADFVTGPPASAPGMDAGEQSGAEAAVAGWQGKSALRALLEVLGTAVVRECDDLFSGAEVSRDPGSDWLQLSTAQLRATPAAATAAISNMLRALAQADANVHRDGAAAECMQTDLQQPADILSACEAAEAAFRDVMADPLQKSAAMGAGAACVYNGLVIWERSSTTASFEDACTPASAVTSSLADFGVAGADVDFAVETFVLRKPIAAALLTASATEAWLAHAGISGALHARVSKYRQRLQAALLQATKPAARAELSVASPAAHACAIASMDRWLHAAELEPHVLTQALSHVDATADLLRALRCNAEAVVGHCSSPACRAGAAEALQTLLLPVPLALDAGEALEVELERRWSRVQRGACEGQDYGTMHELAAALVFVVAVLSSGLLFRSEDQGTDRECPVKGLTICLDMLVRALQLLHRLGLCKHRGATESLHGAAVASPRGNRDAHRRGRSACELGPAGAEGESVEHGRSESCPAERDVQCLYAALRAHLLPRLLAKLTEALRRYEGGKADQGFSPEASGSEAGAASVARDLGNGVLIELAHVIARLVNWLVAPAAMKVRSRIAHLVRHALGTHQHHHAAAQAAAAAPGASAAVALIVLACRALRTRPDGVRDRNRSWQEAITLVSDLPVAALFAPDQASTVAPGNAPVKSEAAPGCVVGDQAPGSAIGTKRRRVAPVAVPAEASPSRNSATPALHTHKKRNLFEQTTVCNESLPSQTATQRSVLEPTLKPRLDDTDNCCAKQASAGPDGSSSGLRATSAHEPRELPECSTWRRACFALFDSDQREASASILGSSASRRMRSARRVSHTTQLLLASHLTELECLVVSAQKRLAGDTNQGATDNKSAPSPASDTHPATTLARVTAALPLHRLKLQPAAAVAAAACLLSGTDVASGATAAALHLLALARRCGGVSAGMHALPAWAPAAAAASGLSAAAIEAAAMARLCKRLGSVPQRASAPTFTAALVRALLSRVSAQTSTLCEQTLAALRCHEAIVSTSVQSTAPPVLSALPPLTLITLAAAHVHLLLARYEDGLSEGDASGEHVAEDSSGPLQKDRAIASRFEDVTLCSTPRLHAGSVATRSAAVDSPAMGPTLSEARLRVSDSRCLGPDSQPTPWTLQPTTLQDGSQALGRFQQASAKQGELGGAADVSQRPQCASASSLRERRRREISAALVAQAKVTLESIVVQLSEVAEDVASALMDVLEVTCAECTVVGSDTSRLRSQNGAPVEASTARAGGVAKGGPGHDAMRFLAVTSHLQELRRTMDPEDFEELADGAAAYHAVLAQTPPAERAVPSCPPGRARTQPQPQAQAQVTSVCTPPRAGALVPSSCEQGCCKRGADEASKEPSTPPLQPRGACTPALQGGTRREDAPCTTTSAAATTPHPWVLVDPETRQPYGAAATPPPSRQGVTPMSAPSLRQGSAWRSTQARDPVSAPPPPTSALAIARAGTQLALLLRLVHRLSRSGTKGCGLANRQPEQLWPLGGTSEAAELGTKPSGSIAGTLAQSLLHCWRSTQTDLLEFLGEPDSGTDTTDTERAVPPWSTPMANSSPATARDRPVTAAASASECRPPATGSGDDGVATDAVEDDIGWLSQPRRITENDPGIRKALLGALQLCGKAGATTAAKLQAAVCCATSIDAVDKAGLLAAAAEWAGQDDEDDEGESISVSGDSSNDEEEDEEPYDEDERTEETEDELDVHDDGAVIGDAEGRSVDACDNRAQQSSDANAVGNFARGDAGALLSAHEQRPQTSGRPLPKGAAAAEAQKRRRKRVQSSSASEATGTRCSTGNRFLSALVELGQGSVEDAAALEDFVVAQPERDYLALCKLRYCS